MLKAIYRILLPEGYGICAAAEGEEGGNLLMIVGTAAYSKVAAEREALARNGRAQLTVTPRFCSSRVNDAGIWVEAEDVLADAWVW